MATRKKTRDDYMLEAVADAETARGKVYRAQTNKDIEEAKKESEAASGRLSRMVKNYLHAGAGRGFENPEAVVPRETNSRSQYEHEKAAGDPNATQMSYEEWKKL